jgi:hypothetical protein
LADLDADGLMMIKCSKSYRFYNTVQRTSGPKRDEVIEGWRKLHNEEVHNLYSSSSTIRMIKSRKIGWVGHVARMGKDISGKRERKRPV